LRILIADDDPNVLAVLTGQLSRWGHEVLTAPDGLAAFALLQQPDPPMLALLDWKMPGMDGVEVCRRARALPEAPAFYAVILTGQGSSDSLVGALEAGADDYLLKPWEAEELRARVAVGVRILQLQAALAGRMRDLEDTVESLRASEERYALAARAANDGLWDWKQSPVDEVYYTPRWKALLGYADDELGASPEEWLGRVHAQDLPKLKEQLQAHLDGQAPTFSSEYRVLHKDGTYRWMLARGVAARDAGGKATRLVGSQTDITDHKAAEELSRHFAMHDPLTGLRNRGAFLERVRFSLSRRKRRHDHLFAVVCLNLDGFKAINDTLGHDFGDLLLKAVAERLATCVRMVDGLGRLGGDGFTVLVDEMSAVADALRVTQRIQSALSEVFNIEGREVFVSASAGIALCTNGYERADDLLRDADTALYRAKVSGRSSYEVFDRELHAQTTRRLRLETELRGALEHNQFRLHYQPIVTLETGKLCGFEALVRWSHPERGPVSPAEFIPVAEETGMILSLGHWVLGEACRQVHNWNHRFSRTTPLSVHVNLSGKEFAEPDVCDRVESVLRETAVEPPWLKLEMTESALMEDSEAIGQKLAQLKAMGLDLHIDDFGTGYSSLSYLHRFPIDTLKIDRSFVLRAGVDEDSLRIVQTIVGLARDLRMEVVAEGVETPEQLRRLKELKCEYGQGFLFSAARDREAAEAMIGADPQW